MTVNIFSIAATDSSMDLLVLLLLLLMDLLVLHIDGSVPFFCTTDLLDQFEFISDDCPFFYLCHGQPYWITDDYHISLLVPRMMAFLTMFDFHSWLLMLYCEVCIHLLLD